MTSSSSAQITKLEEFFKNYFAQDNIPSLKGLYDFDPELFISNSETAQVREKWLRKFKAAVVTHGVQNYSKVEPEWGVILEGVLMRIEANVKSGASKEKQRASSSLSRTSAQRTTNSSSSSNKGTMLTESQLAAFRTKYEAMDCDKMWKLSNGVLVEKKVYEFGLTTPNEHAAHSFIINVADHSWNRVFKPAELAEIQQEYSTPLPKLQSEAQEFLRKFKNLTDIEDMWNIADYSHFHPIDQFDLDWIKRSILDILSAYRWDTVYRTAATGGERDLIMLIWRAIDTCFQNLRVDSSRSDQQSMAGSARCNEDRIDVDGSIKPKVQAFKPDMILKREQLEYAAAENGVSDEAGVGSKELNEKLLKLLKH